MKVTRIAWTIVDDEAMESATDGAYNPLSEPFVKEADLLAEFAGRACYQSWERRNPATFLNKDYLRSTVTEKGHESITAHASVTYYITGISRALTHEMIRHRFLAFSELSQRYVDVVHLPHVTPPAMRGDDVAENDVYHDFLDSKFLYEDLVGYMEKKGLTRKQAREAARAVLPNATETRIVVSGNIRAWRDFLKQRWSVHADAEIRMLAGEILKDLRQIAPNSVQDIPEEPYQ